MPSTYRTLFKDTSYILLFYDYSSRVGYREMFFSFFFNYIGYWLNARIIFLFLFS